MVLLTKGNKTLIFTLTIVLPNPRVSIIIAPFNTLKKNYVGRL